MTDANWCYPDYEDALCEASTRLAGDGPGAIVYVAMLATATDEGEARSYLAVPEGEWGAVVRRVGALAARDDAGEEYREVSLEVVTVLRDGTGSQRRHVFMAGRHNPPAPAPPPPLDRDEDYDDVEIDHVEPGELRDWWLLRRDE